MDRRCVAVALSEHLPPFSWQAPAERALVCFMVGADRAHKKRAARGITTRGDILAG